MTRADRHKRHQKYYNGLHNRWSRVAEFLNTADTALLSRYEYYGYYRNDIAVILDAFLMKMHKREIK